MPVVSDFTSILSTNYQSTSSWRGNLVGFSTSHGTAFSTIVTYSFAQGDRIPSVEESGFDVTSTSAFTTAQRASFRNVVQEYQNLSGLIFVEVEGEGMINLSNAAGSSYGGWAYFPIVTGTSTSQSDLVVDGSGNYSAGSYEYFTMLHELGHAVGLKHPHEGTNTLATYLDNQTQTVMTYNITHPYATHLGIMDAQALQEVYGLAKDLRISDIRFDQDAQKLHVQGTQNADSINGASLSNHIEGAGGDDFLLGREADDWLFGGSGSDSIYSVYGDDQVFGGDGVDWVVSGWGDDTVYGGAGGDNIILEDGNDLAYGSGGVSADDSIFGGYGDDTLYGGSGDDYIASDGGGSVFYGGSGDDKLYAGSGTASLYGGSGNDTLGGSDYYADYLSGGGGADILYGYGQNDKIYGGKSDDDVFGGRGYDILYGGDGDDMLEGGYDNDTLFGGNGDDLLIALYENDYLYGGNGADVFSFEKGNYYPGSRKTAVVADFEDGIDVIEMTGDAWTPAPYGFDDLVFTAASGGADTVISFDVTGISFKIQVLDVEYTDLTVADFIGL